MRRGQWRPATEQKTEFEINKYLVRSIKDEPLRRIGTFELQMILNRLARTYSESIVKHAYVNLRSIMRMAQRLKFISDSPAEDTRMPETKAVDRPTMTAEQIVQLFNGIEDPHDLCLMSIGLFSESKAMTQAEHVGIDGDAGNIEGIAQDHIGRLSPDPW